ncbi:alpha/beta-hydrolase [Neoconidiobolus thromboides FSU 785]|nr:alpha/beta-hydrolase [Neoconidiobolus thromboides FSU 785]
MGLKVSDPSFGRRNMPYHPSEISLRESKEYWWHEEYIQVIPEKSNQGCLNTKKRPVGRLYLQSWCLHNHVENPKAEIIMLHGIAAYGGYLAKLVPNYCYEGYRVHILDLPSHGRSDGIHVDLTEMQPLLDALETVITRVKEYNSRCPIFLLGYSLGGLIGIRYCINNPHSVSGLSLVSPCVKLNSSLVNNSALINFGKLVAKLTPRLTIPSSDNDDDEEEELELELNEASKLTADNRISNSTFYDEDYVKRDPLMFQQSCRIGTMIMILNETKKLVGDLPRLQTPFFVQQGGNDQVLDYRGANMIYDLSGTIDKLTRIYPHLEHNMFNSNTVLVDSIDWLNSQIKRLTPPVNLSKT